MAHLRFYARPLAEVRLGVYRRVMQEAFESILPIATLLIGAGLANFLKLSESRKNLRLNAADQLAELPNLLWNKTEPEAWLTMNAALSRLSIRLILAGVHPDLTERVRVSAISFWQSVYVIGQDDEGDVWSVGESSDENWTEASEIVAELLATNSRIKSWWVGRRARKLLEKWDADEQAMRESLESGK